MKVFLKRYYGCKDTGGMEIEKTNVKISRK
jgi:hypothetical protein